MTSRSTIACVAEQQRLGDAVPARAFVLRTASIFVAASVPASIDLALALCAVALKARAAQVAETPTGSSQ